MEKPVKLETAVQRGLGYLATVQRSGGGFDSFSSPSSSSFTKSFTYQTTFVPAVMLAALSGLELSAARQITDHLATFIRAQASPHWSYNYWSRRSTEYQSQPYPDDLDDTAYAFLGLLAYDQPTVGPDMLAAFVKLLLMNEVKTGGPYRTWLAPPAGEVWQDTDLAVNANIAAVLKYVSQPLPALTALMEQAIRTNKLTSPYYVSSYPLLYYLSRAYQGPESPKLLQTVQTTWNNDPQPTPLHGALLLTTLTRLGARNGRPLVRRLLAAQQPDGSWPAEAFCLDPARDKHMYYHGSECLSTALAIEALQAYHQASPAATPPIPQKVVLRANPDLQFPVLAAAHHDCEELEPELSSSLLSFLRRVAGSSGGAEIVNLPQLFNQSLRRPLPKSRQPRLIRLGLANLYGWTAYTILDDFLDETGQPGLLPAATAALRFSLLTFLEDSAGKRAYGPLITDIFNSIDSANAWELTYCRFKRTTQYLEVSSLPDYGNPTGLANRSLGHALTPLLVILDQGIGVESTFFREVRQALVHYLAARQLNDDLHDWQDDMKNGHITFVVNRILAEAKIKPGRQAWRSLLPIAQQQFWHHSLPGLCRDVRQQTTLARRCLSNVPELLPQNIITDLLDGLDAAARSALTTQKQARQFLAHYRQASL